MCGHDVACYQVCAVCACERAAHSRPCFSSTPSLAGIQHQHLHLHQQECGSAAAAAACMCCVRVYRSVHVRRMLALGCVSGRTRTCKQSFVFIFAAVSCRLYPTVLKLSSSRLCGRSGISAVAQQVCVEHYLPCVRWYTVACACVLCVL